MLISCRSGEDSYRNLKISQCFDYRGEGEYYIEEYATNSFVLSQGTRQVALALHNLL
jgi:hypothetical protein